MPDRELAELLARYGADVAYGSVLRSMSVDDDLLRSVTHQAPPPHADRPRAAGGAATEFASC